jgi:formate hydrogenlyase subunit 6/NADH:ubiquinone oxidoreductase subunit I
MKIPPMTIPTIHQGVERGYFKKDFSDIEVIGDYEHLIPTTYQHAKSNGFMSSNNGLLNLLKRYPRIIKKNCIGCKVCADICPKDTIDIVDKKAVINYDNCISCFCCHEFCPVKAINTKRRVMYHLKQRLNKQNR